MRKIMRKILFGTDPEAEAVYLLQGRPFALPPYWFREELGVSVSDDPKHPIFLTGKDFKVLEDGANFEFSIRPSHDPLELFQRVQEAAKETSEKILSQFPEVCLPELQFLPTINWDVERWSKLPKNKLKKFDYSTRFGCDPDEDVYNLEAKPREVDASLHPYRYCGGHIHISGSPQIAENPHLAIKCMVITAGLAAVAFSDVPGLERDRTFLYGRPGKFRIQNYGVTNSFGKDYQIGVEYRTPSCRWAGKWEIAEKVLKWAEIGIKNLLETPLGLEIHDEIFQDSIDAILGANQPVARDLLAYVESKL